MEIKFSKKLKDYNYILSFDLASHITGWCLLNVKDDLSMSVVASGILDSNEYGNHDMWFSSQCAAFYDVIISAKKYVSYCGGNLLITKERLPNQAGFHSTIATLQSLAQTHAIFNLAMEKSEVDYYDEVGVHSVSVKAFFKGVTGLEKPSKEDIRDAIAKMFGDDSILGLGTDVTDAIGVAVTLVYKKWNSDIDDLLKEMKKMRKQYKSAKKLEEIDSRVDFLKSIKIEVEDNCYGK